MRSRWVSTHDGIPMWYRGNKAEQAINEMLHTINCRNLIGKDQQCHGFTVPPTIFW